jgi:hypothetical protein
LLFTFLLLVATICAQTAPSVTPARLVKFSGKISDANGKPASGLVGITFALYENENGGPPLWLETQNVQVSSDGHFSAMLGASKPEGMPASLFASEQARWLGVQAAGQTEQARVLLVSVPYAMKAANADTVGGLPASAFLLAAPPSGTTAASGSAAETTTTNRVSGAVTGTGTAKFVPLWTSTTALGNSVLFQSGTGSTAKIGIGTTAPAATLDVKGGENLGGLLRLQAMGTATSAAGKNSQAQDFIASSFSSTAKAAVAQTFQWQAEPTGNNTASPLGTLNLLFCSGAGAPAETGLRLSNKGIFTFAAGQKFPGTGTITGVTAGTDLTGGGTTGNVTLNLDTTKVPQLTTANTFAGVQTIHNDLVVSTNQGFNALDVTATGNNDGIAGRTGWVSGYGVSGLATATTGGAGGVLGSSSASSGIGVTGQSPNIGVYGVTTSPFVNSGWGVEGQSATNVGVYGGSAGASTEGASFGTDAGVWGDTGNTSAFTYTGVLGTADNNQGGAFYNNGVSYSALTAANFTSDTGALVFAAGLATFCITDVGGNLFCTGSKSAIVPVDGGSHRVALYAVEAPENWFEDAGSARLSKGEAVVNLEPIFGQAVNTDIEYHVFLTPKGDCKGLYVSRELPTAFVVRELGGGTSSVGFDYRIMAKRKGYESIRLADKTRQFNEQQARVKKLLTRVPSSVKPQLGPVSTAKGLETTRQNVTARSR